MDTLIPSSADLAGDPAVIAPRRGAAADRRGGVGRDRGEAPPAAGPSRQAARGAAVPPADAALRQRHRDRSGHLLPCHRGHRQGRRLDRLVPEPGRRLRDVGGLSRPCRWRRRSSATIRAPCWPGARARGCRAVECEGGYRVTGVWAFASGGRHATWLGAHCPIWQADGSPRLDANGRQVERTMLVPSSEVEWTDIWNVVGLRGTASDQFALTDHFVRGDHSITRDLRRRNAASPARSTACRR